MKLLKMIHLVCIHRIRGKIVVQSIIAFGSAEFKEGAWVMMGNNADLSSWQ